MDHYVSILTRPEGRVLPGVRGQRPAGSAVSILTRPEGRVLPAGRGWLGGKWMPFQSSPGPKAGCYAGTASEIPPLLGFNPHPARRPGATFRAPLIAAQSRPVSILTRPEGRVLPRRGRRPRTVFPVSILTRPEGRVLLDAVRRAATPPPGFNPHPARRPGATGTGPR